MNKWNEKSEHVMFIAKTKRDMLGITQEQAYNMKNWLLQFRKNYKIINKIG